MNSNQVVVSGRCLVRRTLTNWPRQACRCAQMAWGGQKPSQVATSPWRRRLMSILSHRGSAGHWNAGACGQR